MYRELDETRAAARQLSTALSARDVPKARVALTALQQHSTAAATATDGTTWRVVSSLPVVGDDARAVRTMSDVARRVADDAAPPILDAAQAYVDGRLTPRGGAIPVAPVRQLQVPLATSAQVVDDSRGDLESLDGSYVGPVADARDQLAAQLTRASSTLHPVVRAVDLMPSLLGGDEPRTYLLVLQNNAEIRSTGGFAGSTFLVHADSGQISLSDPIAGAQIVRENTQVLPVPMDEKTLFGDPVATSFTAANKEPDFPTAAALMARRYEERSGTHLDGVLATDPVMLSYLLGATGPVDVDGVTLNQQNAVRILLSDVYARFPDPAAQDAFFRQVGESFFGQVSSIHNPQSLVAAARRGADEGRLLLWSTHSREQRLLGESQLSGALPRSTGGRPDIGVYLSDETPPFGSKLSYYLAYDVTIASHGCAGGRQSLGGNLSLRSSAPAGGHGLPPYVLGSSSGDGTETLAVYLVGPVGGRVLDVRVGSTPVTATSVRYHGRPAVRAEVSVPAGGAASVTWAVESGRGQIEGADVAVTPGVQPVDASFVSTVGCAPTP